MKLLRIDMIWVVFSCVVVLYMLVGAGCFPNQGVSGDKKTLYTVGDVHVLRFEVSPHTVACTGVAPQRCLVVNGALFYDTIEGYAHREGLAHTLEVKRTTVCDPTQFNMCPTDASPYRYHLVRVLT